MSTEQAYRPVRHTIVGTAQSLDNALRTAQRQGRLVSVSGPRPVGHQRYAVTVVLLDSPPAETAVRGRTRRRPIPRKVYAVLGALAALAVLAVAVVAALRWIAAHAPILAGAVVVILLSLAMLRRRTGACMGLHCAGCGHR